MKLRNASLLLALALLMGLALVGPSVGLPPLVDPDEPDDCIGPSDPFCAGGTTTTCKICRLKNGTFKCLSDPAGRGDVCTIVFLPGSMSCGITGNC